MNSIAQLCVFRDFCEALKGGRKVAHKKTDDVFRTVEEGGWMIPYEKEDPVFPGAIERLEACDSLSSGILAIE